MKNNLLPTVRGLAYYLLIMLIVVFGLAWVAGLVNGNTLPLLIDLIIPVVLMGAGGEIIWGTPAQKEREIAAFARVEHAPARAFRAARAVWRNTRRDYHPHPLHETGAVGANLLQQRVCGRQSGRSTSRKPSANKKDSDADGRDGEPPEQHLPLVLTTQDLATVLSVSAKTLQNQPASALPPAIRLPGCRGPRYRRLDVLAWLDGFLPESRAPQKNRRRIGRPRIAHAGKGGSV
ncbi:hypothetical protein BBC27_11280 [Acidithiobacillus ferrivorans]|uniref:Helix-turn-helix domain-containing protein n=1 Tax=Acidithiobacillus ferrivorans TaxID=160808 RepID=A0A1B9BYL6_9PROT|nr:hypothetical protein [Acidithiobacillus ferrivorans]OCB02797.1 hypothetical protein BBC27_11280 [Acidithiobacillus ferrivorans]